MPLFVKVVWNEEVLSTDNCSSFTWEIKIQSNNGEFCDCLCWSNFFSVTFCYWSVTVSANKLQPPPPFNQVMTLCLVSRGFSKKFDSICCCFCTIVCLLALLSRPYYVRLPAITHIHVKTCKIDRKTVLTCLSWWKFFFFPTSKISIYARAIWKLKFVLTGSPNANSESVGSAWSRYGIVSWIGFYKQKDKYPSVCLAV